MRPKVFTKKTRQKLTRRKFIAVAMNVIGRKAAVFAKGGERLQDDKQYPSLFESLRY